MQTGSDKSPLKITPGKVIVPTDRMRRIWGELISLDLKMRTGKFRNEGNDEVTDFTVLPYAELYHHAAYGALQDFRVGERAIFRLHENEQGKWMWLTYIQDEMNFLVGHKEFFGVDRIDAGQCRLEVTLGSADRSFVRTKGLFLETDGQTRFWKSKARAQFADIKAGDRLRTQTHGMGKGRARVCWEIFLDEESVADFQAKQQAVHARCMDAEGLPGYVDKNQDGKLELTLFQEAREQAKSLKSGQKIRIAAAGADRKAVSAGIEGIVTGAKMAGNLGKIAATITAPAEELIPGTVVRLFR